MKKFLSLFALIFAISAVAFANVEVEGIAYEINEDGTAKVTQKNPCYSGDVAIPASISLTKRSEYSVTTIGSIAFLNCVELTGVSIPESVTSIGNYAFSGCSMLADIVIPNSVTAVGGYAFRGCSSLGVPVYNDKIFVVLPQSYSGSYAIPEGIETIAYGAFDGCEGLTEIIIPGSVREIGDNAFKGCTGLTHVDIPEGVTSIGYEAFSGCTNLATVSLPNSVTDVQNFAFKDCYGLQEPVFNDHLFVAMPRNHSGEYDMPEGIVTVVNSAFYGCINNYSVVLPESVTAIGNDAFRESGLTAIELPENLEEIGDAAFLGCFGLEELHIPAGVSEIGGFAFAMCSGLTSITCDALTPPQLGASVFLGVDTSIPLYVPEEAIDAYREAEQWNEFNIQVIDDWDIDHPLNPGNYLLTLIAEPEGYGTFEGEGLNEEGEGLYAQNAEVEFKAVANHGYRFVKWTDGVEDAQRSIVIVRDTTFTALFELDEFLIKFNNYNDTLLQEKKVKFGEMPVYTGEEPKHDPTDEYAFFFAGWNPEIVPVVDEATYTAVFDSLAYPDTVIISDTQNLSEMFVGPITHVIATETAVISIPTPVKVKSLTLWVSNIDAPSISNIENLTAETVDMVLRLEPYEEDAVRSKWYVFAVPFNVEVSSGIRVEGAEAPAVLGRKFVLDQYSGPLRSLTQNGWERVSADATLLPGVAYMISVNGTDNYWRFTMSGSTPIHEQTSVNVYEYPSEIGEHHAGWNNASNISWQRSMAEAEGILYGTIYHNDLSQYEVVLLSEYEFFSFCPVFIQAPEDGVVNFHPVPAAEPVDGANAAPRRRHFYNTNEAPISLSIAQSGAQYADKAYLTFSTNASGYTIGRDLQKMMNANATIPMLWLEGYGLQLAAHEAMLADGTAKVPVGFYAPADGTYQFNAANVADGTQVYLAYNGNIVWNLTQGGCQLQLARGNNSGYSLVVTKQPVSLPDFDDAKLREGINVEKFIKDGTVYIRQNNNVFDAQGRKAAK